METTAAPTHQIKRLTRSRSNHYIGGVAGGLGDYFGVDPVIFRIGFIALVFAGASGFALYVMAWLLLPAEGAEHSILGRRFASGRAGRTIRNLLAAAAVAFVALVAVATASLGIIAASSDVPFRGGVGDRTWAPSSVQEVRSSYHLMAGDMTLDLSHVAIPEGVTRVDASVVTGHLVITVPKDANVSVDAHAGAGQVKVFGDSDEGRDADRSVAAESGSRLELTAKAGVGEVEVVRG